MSQCDRCSSVLTELSDDSELHPLRHARQNRQVDVATYDESDQRVVRGLLNRLREHPDSSSDPLPPSDDPRAMETAAAPDSTYKAPASEANPASSPYLTAFDEATMEAALPDGRFRVERLLATGGAAAVYLAFDRQLSREVAIKVLTRDSMRDRQRFLREAKLLAELDHPHIVRLFDFGELQLPGERVLHSPMYLVMERLAGGTSLVLTAEQPIWRDADNRMTFERLAELLAQAADGLAAAHRQGLIHRDVKPSNLLLDADGNALKVADFGLARFADEETAPITRTGDIVGTPAFMSPEQVTHDRPLTASADIYSLGATMYQLLTGAPPFQGSPAAILRQVADATPAAPQLINPKVPSDLATICEKAMTPEPAARYRSMSELAADLRRFATGQPIHAKPVGAVGQALRLLRKNRQFAYALAVSVALAALLLIGSVTTAVMLSAKNQQLAEAVTGERDAKLAAEEALQESIDAADQLLLTVTTETEFLPRTPGSQVVTEKLLRRARDYFQRFLDANQDNAELAFHLARAHAGLAEVAERLGDSETLEQETTRALETLDSIPPTEITLSQRARVKADALVVWANFLVEAGEAKRAIPLLDDAVLICQAAWDDGGRDEKLIANFANAELALAIARTWVGELESAMKLLAETRVRFEQLHRDYPESAEYLRDLAVCDLTLATTAIDRGEPAEGKEYLLRAKSVLDQVGEEDAISLRIRELKTKLLTNLALAERRMGNNAEAALIYQDAIAESRRLIELEPTVPSHRWNLVVAALNSGGPDLALGNLEELATRWQLALGDLNELIAMQPDNQRYIQVKAMMQSNIAIVLRDLGKLEEALEPLQQATLILEQQAKQLDYAAESYLPVALNHYELATTLIELKRWEEASAALDESDAIVAAILARDPDFLPATTHQIDAELARLDIAASQAPTSEPTLQRARQLLERATALRDEHPDVIDHQIQVPSAMLKLAELLNHRDERPAALVQVRATRVEVQQLGEGTDGEVVEQLRLDATRLHAELLEVMKEADPQFEEEWREVSEQLRSLESSANGESKPAAGR